MELDLGAPPKELLEFARKELGENPETRVQVLEDLRDYIYERGECIPHRTDDAFLLRFLRARNFIVERAHRLLVNYYRFKENNPAFHKNVRPLDLGFIGDDDVLSIPPYREQTGRRLMIYRIGNWDTSSYGTDEIFKATLCILELGILEERAQILGGICIFDLAGLTLQHAWQVTPSVAAKVIEIMVTSFPMKIHAIHIINQPWAFEVVYNVFKPLLDARMRSKLFFHGADMDSLHKHIDPKCLPEKYGGVRAEHNYKDWLFAMENNKSILKEVRSLGYIVEDEDIKEFLKKNGRSS